MKRFVVGTAGHVDHGKTSLVQALTGVDTDRLPEEKRRGISIELGYAPLALAPDLFASIIDVPGHERFIRTMVAGAGGIDIMLLVIDANEGIRPQTREHAEICQWLGVRHAVVALTKADLVDDSALAKIFNEVRHWLDPVFPAAPIVPVCAPENRGIMELKSELTRVGRLLPEPEMDGTLLLPIDRVFSKPRSRKLPRVLRLSLPV